jgi:threonine synthase
LMKECGVDEFGVSSTGNSSTALAYLVQCFEDFRLKIFTGESFVSRVQHTASDRIQHFSLLGGSFVDAAQCALQFAKERGLQPERGFFNPARREGLKLAALEAFEQLPQGVDYYVQAVSSAMGVYGVYRGAQQFLQMGKIAKVPSMICVQQQSCQPMVSAYEAGSETIRQEDIVPQPEGIASAILRGDPSRAYPYIRSIVIETQGEFVSVSDSEIREARFLMEDEEGLSPCFTAAAAFAGLVKLSERNRLDREATILVNLTGGDRRPDATEPGITQIRRRSSGSGWEIPDV